MANGETGTETTWTPPYIAWRTLLNLFERLETNMPPQIDKTFLSGSNQSNTQTMNALKSLGLIQDDGSVTERLMGIIEADMARPAAVRTMLEEFYPEPVELGTMKATQRQLDEAFEAYGVSGSTLRKAVSFYLKAAAYAGVPLSPNFKTPSKSASGPRKRRTRSKSAGEEADAPDRRPTGPSLPALKARYVEMLMKKAEGQEEMDGKLLDRIEGLLDFGERPNKPEDEE